MTNQTQAMQDALNRTRNYPAIDGIPEILLGAIWIIWGTAVFLPVLFPGAIPTQARPAIILASMLLMPFVFRRGMRAWKERITYPRTGYVEMRKLKLAKSISYAVIGGALGFVMGELMTRGGAHLRQWMPLGFGLLMFTGFLHLASRLGSMRLAILSLPLVAVGLALSLQHVDFLLSVATLLVICGVISVGDGLLVLRSYVRSHPLPAAE